MCDFRLENVEVRRAGQAFRLGRYAIHFHLSGRLNNSWVRHCSIHHSFNRAITAHGVHGMLFERNVAYDIMGHTFFIVSSLKSTSKLDVALLLEYVPCNLETSRSLRTAPCSLHAMQSADCARLFQWRRLWRDNFKENRENCHDFIVLCCVRNWEGILVVENLVRHNNRSFRANKLVIVSPNYKQENE